MCGTGLYFDHQIPVSNDANCGETLTQYFGAFLPPNSPPTKEDCASQLDPSAEPDGAVSVSWGTTYLGTKCCAGGPVQEVNMCGDTNYDPMEYCVDGSTFQSTKNVDHHCLGDEEIKDEMECKKVGEEAWDPNAEEQCDVGMLKGTDVDKQIACEELGGFWEPRNCGYHAMLAKMMLEGGGPGIMEVPPDYAGCLAYNIGTHCCFHNDGTPAPTTKGWDACQSVGSPEEPPPEPMCIKLSAEKVSMLTDKGYPPVNC